MPDADSRFQASALVKRFGRTIADAASGYPVIDVACGGGRNAAYLADLGCRVICIDRDLTKLKRNVTQRRILQRLELIEMDLRADPWPFRTETSGGIVLVDFLDSSLFASFEDSLMPGGYLLIETVSARGGNYMELPRPGELRKAFEGSVDFRLYRERAAGPSTSNAVTVKMLARRRLAAC